MGLDLGTGRLRIIASTFAVVAGLLATGSAEAAPGDMDQQFGKHGRLIRDLGNGDEAQAVAIQDDGRILVAGDVGRRVPGTHRYTSVLTVARFRPGGRLDRSFAGDGSARFDLPGGSNHLGDMAIQPDGRIVLAGYSGSSNMWDGSVYDLTVARLRPSGKLDRTFSGNGVASMHFDNGYLGDARAYGVVIQDDGRIVVAGESRHDSSAKAAGAKARSTEAVEIGLALARFMPDGTPDNSFSDDGKQVVGEASEALAVTLQDDGRIVAVGREVDEATVARFNTDGTLDDTFSEGGLYTSDLGFAVSTLQDVAVLDDGGIVVTGDGGLTGFVTARLTSAGELDPAFAGNGIQTTDFRRSSEPAALAIEEDGRLVVAGKTRAKHGTADLAMARYLADGTPDSSFGTGGERTTDFSGRDDRAYDMAITLRGRVLVAGQSNSDTALARYLSE